MEVQAAVAAAVESSDISESLDSFIQTASSEKCKLYYI